VLPIDVAVDAKTRGTRSNEFALAKQEHTVREFTSDNKST
jgi:hypothetical protein